jgi:hypothetical protein
VFAGPPMLRCTRRSAADGRSRVNARSFDGHDMRVSAEDIVALTGFPLLWRWTQEAHAMFEPDDLAAIRPIRSTAAAVICDGIVSNPVVPGRLEDRIVMGDDGDPMVVRKWLDDRVSRGEDEVLLVWTRETAAIVTRRLFIDRWSDFWYPCSDDLTVIGNVGAWRIEMYHDGTFDFSADGAVIKPLQRTMPPQGPRV